MASMRCYRPTEEICYEEQQLKINYSQPSAYVGAGYQMDFKGQYGLTQGCNMGYQTDSYCHSQTSGYHGQDYGYGTDMSHHMDMVPARYGSMGHQNDQSHEMGFGHSGQFLSKHGKHREFDGMAFLGKDEKKMKYKMKKEFKTKQKHSHKKKDHSSSSSSSSDSD